MLFRSIFADLCNFMFLFGALTGYMIVIGDVLLPFTEWLGPLHHRWFVVGTKEQLLSASSSSPALDGRVA